MRKGKEKISSGRLWMGSMIAALIAAVAVFIIMLQIEKNTLSQFEKETIYVADRRIPKGQVVNGDNWQTYLRQMEVDKSCISPFAIREEAELRALSALYDIEEGTFLTSGMFEPLEEVLKNMKEPVIASFKAEDLYQVVSGTLRPGDRIHIYQVNENGEVMLGWENVFVQQVFDHSGLTISCEDMTSAAQRINVYLDKNCMEEFYAQLATGSLRAVKALQ